MSVVYAKKPNSGSVVNNKEILPWMDSSNNAYWVFYSYFSLTMQLEKLDVSGNVVWRKVIYWPLSSNQLVGDSNYIFTMNVEPDFADN